MLHFAAGGIGFPCLVVACFLVARRMLPTFSRVTGAVFGAGFLALVAGGGQAWSLLTFTAAVILASAWITYRLGDPDARCANEIPDPAARQPTTPAPRRRPS